MHISVCRRDWIQLDLTAVLNKLRRCAFKATCRFLLLRADNACFLKFRWTQRFYKVLRWIHFFFLALTHHLDLCLTEIHNINTYTEWERVYFQKSWVDGINHLWKGLRNVLQIGHKCQRECLFLFRIIYGTQSLIKRNSVLPFIVNYLWDEGV